MDIPKEGSLYKILNAYGKHFEIRYGYYSDAERDRWDPTPIFPNFIKQPQYTDCGRPYATAEQDICDHYHAKPQASGEDWCNDCIHFRPLEEIIGICDCKKRRLAAHQTE